MGVAVLTDAPIADALIATQAVKQKFPKLITVWGGWHPSLFPEECLEEDTIDIVVNGKGEIPFASICDAIFKKNLTQKFMEFITGKIILLKRMRLNILPI